MVMLGVVLEVLALRTCSRALPRWNELTFPKILVVRTFFLDFAPVFVPYRPDFQGDIYATDERVDDALHALPLYPVSNSARGNLASSQRVFGTMNATAYHHSHIHIPRIMVDDLSEPRVDMLPPLV